MLLRIPATHLHDPERGKLSIGIWGATNDRMKSRRGFLRLFTELKELGHTGLPFEWEQLLFSEIGQFSPHRIHVQGTDSCL